MNKTVRIRVISWLKKFSQVANNIEWKKNRNLHAIYLLDMLINKRLEEPYNKMPNDSPLPILSKTLIKSKLSSKFWEKTKYIYETNSVNNKDIPIGTNINKNLINSNKNNSSTGNLKLKNKRVKTPSMKHNIRYINEKKVEKYYINNDEDNLKKENIKNNNELEMLKDTAIKLEKELIKNEKIIEQQKNKKIQLTNKINKLTEMLKSFI